MFRKMPFILLAVIVATLLLAPMMPLEVKQGLYAISLSIKEVIVFLLPWIIFGLLFKAMLMLSKNATKMIGIILVFVCGSNFLSTFLSHYLGMGIYHLDLGLIVPSDANGFKALWTFNLPRLIANDKAMFAGIILGMSFAKLFPVSAVKIADRIEYLVGKLLQYFVYFIPLFVSGFMVKLQNDGVVGLIVRDYTVIFVFIAFAQFSYLALIYFLLNKGAFQAFFSHLKNMLPAAISGFSTMSSAVSMPLSIIGVENSVQNKDLARSVIPATVNIHLLGDCIAIPIFAYAVLKSFGVPEPSLMSYLIFTFYFVLAKFSVAAIPGGGIIVMIPILEAYLGFNSEMISLITALYILFDPVITCTNVLGNGAFAKAIDNWTLFLEKRKQSHALSR